VNKLNVPIYVDWKESAIIVGNEAQSYWKDESTIDAIAYRSQSTITSSSEASITGVLVRDERIGFIPPRSSKTTSLVTLHESRFRLTGEKRVEKVTTVYGTTDVTKYSFEGNSPLMFRSYITLSTDPSFSTRWNHESEFWVSEVAETTLTPNSYQASQSNNTFHTANSMGAYALIVSIGVILFGFGL
jgi:hypothetical protein